MCIRDSVEIPQVAAQILLCNIHFVRPFYQGPGLLMNSLVRRYLIKIVEHLPEINAVMADTIPCEQAYQVTAAGIDRCRRLLGIGESKFLYLQQPYVLGDKSEYGCTLHNHEPYMPPVRYLCNIPQDRWG